MIVLVDGHPTAASTTTVQIEMVICFINLTFSLGGQAFA